MEFLKSIFEGKFPNVDLFGIFFWGSFPKVIFQMGRGFPHSVAFLRPWLALTLTYRESLRVVLGYVLSNFKFLSESVDGFPSIHRPRSFMLAILFLINLDLVLLELGELSGISILSMKMPHRTPFNPIASCIESVGLSVFTDGLALGR